jgi:reactive intermediate/imine deaminase
MPLPGGHYSPGIVAAGLVFVAGQLPIASDGSKLSDASFADQTRQVLANVQAVIEAAGSSVARLAQVRVYITDIDHWPEFNRLYAEWAGEARPARAVVPVPVLHYGFMLEIEAVAVL